MTATAASRSRVTLSSSEQDMNRFSHLSRGKLVAAGAILVVVLLGVLAWRQFRQRPGQLPTAEEFNQPIGSPGSGDVLGLTGGRMTKQQVQEIKEGKTVTV